MMRPGVVLTLLTARLTAQDLPYSHDARAGRSEARGVVNVSRVSGRLYNE
jgi:hypothetical protein